MPSGQKFSSSQLPLTPKRLARSSLFCPLCCCESPSISTDFTPWQEGNLRLKQQAGVPEKEEAWEANIGDDYDKQLESYQQWLDSLKASALPLRSATQCNATDIDT